MEKIYADLIRKGKKTIDNVPAKLVPGVYAELIRKWGYSIEDVSQNQRQVVTAMLNE